MHYTIDSVVLFQPTIINSPGREGVIKIYFQIKLFKQEIIASEIQMQLHYNWDSEENNNCNALKLFPQIIFKLLV